jgi:Pentapeptide repeats (8 copies)
LDFANLQGANLFNARVQGADLSGANLQGAELRFANLRGALYEPDPDPAKLPAFWTLIYPRNQLDTLVFHRSPAALVALREAFKKGGMRTQERQLTYAIEHTKRLQEWDPLWYRDHSYKQDERSWLEKLAGKGESLFSYALFELPSHYGMAPGRALWGLLSLIPIFALPYWAQTQQPRYQGQ